MFSENSKQIELPLKLHISFEKVFTLFEKYAKEEFAEHPYHKGAQKIVEQVNRCPELISGFSDVKLLKKYEQEISYLLDPLFPEALMLNEIKAATVPFTFIPIKHTSRFENILSAAGENYKLLARNFEDDLLYIQSCSMILGQVYGHSVDLRRPFFFDIPDEEKGITKNYRAVVNGDFCEIIPTKKAKKITEQDFRMLLDNFDNIEVWKEMFPPGSYILKGFVLMNLFDVTTDETLSGLKEDLLKKDHSVMVNVERRLQDFYNIRDLRVGYSILSFTEDYSRIKLNKNLSIIISGKDQLKDGNFFCDGIVDRVFKQKQPLAISDVKRYGERSNKNGLYKILSEKGINSLIMIPIEANDNSLAVLEIASPREYELNSVNQNKLKDVISVFEAAVQRAGEEEQNLFESFIQEHYTSIHPSVKWRFYESAENYYSVKRDANNPEMEPKIEEIIFEDVYPLFGQCDIKGSSLARNQAIKKDLTTQLELAIQVLNEACKTEELPIYNELMFRVNEYVKEVESGLKAGDEVGILEFLKKDIYPVFKHIKKINKALSKLVKVYTNRLDDNLHVVYEKRKDYENSVTILNHKLAKHIDNKQEESQAMFPHYFERYKTDGVEYNMYIGQSLVKDKKYDKLYLYNLRLWQLQLMYEMENVAFTARKEMKHDLRVASLVLVHSNSLAIKFRMDEKQFDVDGAYNIRYEIIKKRIDKAHIKGTNERLTVPGKLAIVYSQDKDAIEYMKYLSYLKSKNYFTNIEHLELEDLQGVSGLKALRAEVVYTDNFENTEQVSIDELLQNNDSLIATEDSY